MFFANCPCNRGLTVRCLCLQKKTDNQQIPPHSSNCCAQVALELSTLSSLQNLSNARFQKTKWMQVLNTPKLHVRKYNFEPSKTKCSQIHAHAIGLTMLANTVWQSSISTTLTKKYHLSNLKHAWAAVLHTKIELWPKFNMH